ncbi:hypothetical protein, partial [Mesorhizobium sp.]|uniref:hypothetical protein n=1 Tax=Mesorhizobium sp. TaxID=1871066 RepID=UPI0025BE7E81
KEALGRPQRHHARQNRLRMNTVAMPLPEPKGAAGQNIEDVAVSGGEISVLHRGLGVDGTAWILGSTRVASLLASP